MKGNITKTEWMDLGGGAFIREVFMVIKGRKRKATAHVAKHDDYKTISIAKGVATRNAIRGLKENYG